jgi:hypothetical protein
VLAELAGTGRSRAGLEVDSGARGGDPASMRQVVGGLPEESSRYLEPHLLQSFPCQAYPGLGILNTLNQEAKRQSLCRFLGHLIGYAGTVEIR